MAANKLKSEFAVDIYNSIVKIYNRDLDESAKIPLDQFKRSRISLGVAGAEEDSRVSETVQVPCRKWHPLTHAVHSENVELVQHLFKHLRCPMKKALKVPQLDIPHLNRMFPFRKSIYQIVWHN